MLFLGIQVYLVNIAIVVLIRICYLLVRLFIHTQGVIIMAKKKVFVSFDWDNDKHYKFLLQAWNANPDFEFAFSDYSSSAINSWDIPTVKAALTRKINTSTHTLVLVGKEANKKHADSVAIGYKNWLNFEIAKSKANRNKLIAVKLSSTNTSPDELLNSGANWAMSFARDTILKALKDA